MGSNGFWQRSGPCRRIALFAVMPLLWSRSGIGQLEPVIDDPVAIARECVEAIEAIRSFEGRVTVAEIQDEESLRAKGDSIDWVLTDDGHVVVYDYQMKWERSSGRQAWEGHRFMWSEKTGLSSPFVRSASDGAVLRWLSVDERAGVVGPAGGSREQFRHVQFLLGHQLISSPSRDVSTLLSGNVTLAGFHHDDPQLPILEVPYLRRRGADAEEPMLLRVVVDRRHGFMPCRIEIHMKSTGTIWASLELTEFMEYDQDAWLPTKGDFLLYRAELVAPLGDSFNSAYGMNQSDRDRIGAHFLPVNTNQGQQVVIAKEGLRINKRFENSEFELEFPTGTRVFDSVGKRKFIVQDDRSLAPFE